MAVPAELFRVWVEVKVEETLAGPTLYEWVNVWYVITNDAGADPIDVAAPFAAWVNQGITGGFLAAANVVSKYGGRRVAAGGPDSTLTTGALPVGGAVSLLPWQCAVLVLGGTARPRSQTRKWIGGGRLSWVDANTGVVDSSVPAQNAWWLDSLTPKTNGALTIRPVVWDAFREEVHEIEFRAIMKAFRTQRRRSLVEEGQFT